MNINFYKKNLNASEQDNSEAYQNFLVKELILRDYLAIDRTMLTNENTFLAYIRTSLTVLVVSATLIHFFTDIFSQIAGVAMALAGLLVFTFGFFRTSKMKSKLAILKRKKEVILASHKLAPIVSPLDPQILQKEMAEKEV